jgi:hypothetical protein
MHDGSIKDGGWKMEDGNALNHEIHESPEMVFFRAILRGDEVCSFGGPETL